MKSELKNKYCAAAHTNDSIDRYKYLALIHDKYFVAANFHNNEAVLPDLIAQLLHLVAFFGPDRLFVSVFESGSEDKTKDILRHLNDTLDVLGVSRRIKISDEKRNPEGHRIEYLAHIRNEAMTPLYETDIDFDRVIFMNDVFYCANDVKELLHQTRIQKSDITCAMDFGPRGTDISFYDNWVAHDMGGFMFGFGADDFLVHQPSNKRYKEGIPFQVSCCWNGLVVLDPRPFSQHYGVRFRRIVSKEVNTTLLPVYKARRLDNLLPLSDHKRIYESCSASECSNLCSDFVSAGFERMVVVPRVRVAYEYPFWATLRSPSKFGAPPLVEGFGASNRFPLDTPFKPEENQLIDYSPLPFAREETSLRTGSGTKTVPPRTSHILPSQSPALTYAATERALHHASPHTPTSTKEPQPLKRNLSSSNDSSATPSPRKKKAISPRKKSLAIEYPPAAAPSLGCVYIGTSGFPYKSWHPPSAAASSRNKTKVDEGEEVGAGEVEGEEESSTRGKGQTSQSTSDAAQGRYFYPPNIGDQALSFFFARYPCVELNVTFYTTPIDSMFRGWRKRTEVVAQAANPTTDLENAGDDERGMALSPRFIVKANRYFTHMKRLHVDEKFRTQWTEFWRKCSILRDDGSEVVSPSASTDEHEAVAGSRMSITHNDEPPPQTSENKVQDQTKACALGKKKPNNFLAGILFQFPPNFHCTDANVARLHQLSALFDEVSPILNRKVTSSSSAGTQSGTPPEQNTSGTDPDQETRFDETDDSPFAAFEFRHPSWFSNPSTVNLFRQLGWVLVTIDVNTEKHGWCKDLTSGSWPQPITSTVSTEEQEQDHPDALTPVCTRPGVLYVRFHGPNGQYVGSYRDEELTVGEGNQKVGSKARGRAGRGSGAVGGQTKGIRDVQQYG
ncbi:capsular associated protein [Quaeritorhiza haematococci]|nr:capsular associated protein [Quaeritorhiza haematococci]